jgi:hypothetical protein
MDENMLWIIVFLMVAVLFYMYFLKGRYYEGMENKTSSTSVSTTANGLAGNAQSYAAGIQTLATGINDQLLITKYRSDYENVILSYDNLINSMMLQTLVSTNGSNPAENLKKIADLNAAKVALNSVMKYVDSQ